MHGINIKIIFTYIHSFQFLSLKNISVCSDYLQSVKPFSVSCFATYTYVYIPPKYLDVLRSNVLTISINNKHTTEHPQVTGMSTSLLRSAIQ